MRVSDFSYDLPDNLIAQYPTKIRGASRLLVLNRNSGKIEHRNYTDIIEFLKPGDTLILNNTKVIKARIITKNSNGQDRELLLLEDHHTMDPHNRRAIYRGKLCKGEKLKVASEIVTVKEVLDGGIAIINSEIPLLVLAETFGSVPLPPYMHRNATKEDVERYQTIFAKEAGSVAAPTASLNFTQEIERSLKAKGVNIAYLTLHVGLGTFLPIRDENLESHVMHSEYFEIPKVTIETIQKTKLNSLNIVALGTTVARTLEFCSDKILNQKPESISGEADIFIYPGYKFKVVDSLITNFHAPKTTVLMLASAFAGWDKLSDAYEEAIKEKYSFLSYGDSMLII